MQAADFSILGWPLGPYRGTGVGAGLTRDKTPQTTDEVLAGLRSRGKPAPTAKRATLVDRPFCYHTAVWICLVGTIGFEPTTPTMSRWCSNQLSYVPAVGRIIRRSLTFVKRNFIKKSAALLCRQKIPTNKKGDPRGSPFLCTASRGGFDLVGTIGFEPTTPTMSRWCSNQLSYVPAVGRILRNRRTVSTLFLTLSH